MVEFFRVERINQILIVVWPNLTLINLSDYSLGTQGSITIGKQNQVSCHVLRGTC